MKKLIAMLLAVALIASFGVTSAFAANVITWADSSAWVAGRIDNNVSWRSDLADKKSVESEVAGVYEALDAGDISYQEAVFQLAALKLDYDTNYRGWGITELNADLFDLSKVLDADGKVDWALVEQAVIDARTVAAATGTVASNAKNGWYNLLAEQRLVDSMAAKEKEAAAIAAAKAAARDTYFKSDMTAADKLVYNMTLENIDAQASLRAAKAAAEAAKAELATAQGAAKTALEAKYAEAQADAYAAMASAYADAVAEYITQLSALF